MGEQVERLEHDPDPAPDLVRIDIGQGDIRAVNQDPAGVDRLEQVDAPEQGRLATAGRTDQAHDLVFADGEVDPAQDLELVEALVQTLDPDELSAHRAPAR